MIEGVISYLWIRLRDSMWDHVLSSCTLRHPLVQLEQLCSFRSQKTWSLVCCFNLCYRSENGKSCLQIYR